MNKSSKSVKVLRDSDIFTIKSPTSSRELEISVADLKNIFGELPTLPNDGNTYITIIVNNEVIWQEFNTFILGYFEGITLNNKTIGGVKYTIEITDVLNVPIFWQYNLFGALNVDGIVNLEGEINFI